jgi:hypothetical protein
MMHEAGSGQSEFPAMANQSRLRVKKKRAELLLAGIAHVITKTHFSNRGFP